MNRTILLGALLCAASLGFAGARVDFDHGTHFANYKTYSWAAAGHGRSHDKLFPNQLMQERIVGFIEEALAAKGLKRVPQGGDLVISYRVNVQAEPQYVTWSDGGWPGWDWGWGGGFAVTTVDTFYDGTLIVDLVDANQNKLVFQGTSTQGISSHPERNTKRLAKSVAEIFEKYPPRH